MITDKLATFCDGVALNTGGAGNYVLGDQIDLGAARGAGFMGGVDGLFLVITVDVAADSANDTATASFSLLTDSGSNMTTAPVVLATTAVLAVPALVKGKLVAAIALPSDPSAYKRYLGIRQTTGVEAFTAGAINAFLTPTPPTPGNFAYPDGI